MPGEQIGGVAQGAARGPELIRLGVQPAHRGEQLDGLVDQRLGLAGVRERVRDARGGELVPDRNAADGGPDLVGDQFEASPRLNVGDRELDGPTFQRNLRRPFRGALPRRPVREGGGGDVVARIRRAHGRPAGWGDRRP